MSVEDSGKKAYAKPSLTAHGTVAKLTQGGTGTKADVLHTKK